MSDLLLSRRGLLAAALAVGAATAAGCTSTTGPRRPAEVPDAAALAAALAAERALIREYDAVVATLPTSDRAAPVLRQLRAQHADHLVALAAAAGTSPAPSPGSPTTGGSPPPAAPPTPGTGAGGPQSRLARAERGGISALQSAAIAATAGGNAALLASVAASHAVHAQLLTRPVRVAG